MADEMKTVPTSALPEDFWERVPKHGVVMVSVQDRPDLVGWFVIDGWPVRLTNKACAALALYGQPFGFTREDVQTCRGIADQADAFRLNAGAERWLRSLADRIAALLPPEDGG